MLLINGFALNLAEISENVIKRLYWAFHSDKKELHPLSEHFRRAWLHLVTSIILTSYAAWSRNFDLYRVTRHVQEAKSELEEAEREVYSRLQASDLAQYEICDAYSLSTMLLDNSVQSIGHWQGDVGTVYSNYLKQIRFELTENPFDRRYQQKLRYFIQETSAVLTVLNDQQTVFDGLKQSIEQLNETAKSSGPLATDTDRQELVLNRCAMHIASDIDLLQALQREANELGEWQSEEMEFKKDRQESAIMVFTIVTIIFLPLSFVASIFGMNTRDIRNMSQKQWAYWAAAVPLTVVVIVGSLWWAEELEGVGSWLAKSTNRKKPRQQEHQKWEKVNEDYDYPRRSRRRRLFYPLEDD
jgi:Mg2+ and Co2+ transporter CorA